MKKNIIVNDNRITFLDENDSSSNVVIFIHGSGATKHTWMNQISSDLNGYRKIALDLPGHGESTGSGLTSIELYSSFIKSFTEKLNLKNIVLAGHSMGGAIVQNFALNYPDKVKAVVLAGTGAKLKVHQDILKQTLENINYAQNLAYCEHTDKKIIEQAEIEFNFTSEKVRYNDFLACNNFDVMEKVKNITAKTLVIVGNCDKLTPLKYAFYLQTQIKGSTLKIIENAGHMSMWEKPDYFNCTLNDFLGSIL